MLNGGTFLAVIPARGGSKRLARKNVLDLNGKPLIAWSIEAALDSKYIDKVIVTSDDKEILEIASRLNCATVNRPDALAQDESTTFDVVEHVIKHSDTYDYVVLLQPTSPLRTVQQIDEAIMLLNQKKADAIVSVSKVDHSPLWANTLPEDGSMNGFIKPEVKNLRSQDLPVYYRLNGAIYIIKTDRLLSEKTFLPETNIYSYVMDANTSIDIDNEVDFKLASILMT